MQSVQKFFMGMDVSKNWVDLALMQVVGHRRQPMVSARFDNTPAGIEALDHWLRDHRVSFDPNSLLVVENTGLYPRRIREYCTLRGLPLHIGNAAAIKWSLGLVRGKSDQIDSRRLCAYAYKNHEDLKPAALHCAELVGLKDLLRARSRLKTQAASIRVYLRELAHSTSPGMQALLEQAHQAALTGIKESLKAVEEQIRTVLAANPVLGHNYRLLVSVPGVGHLTAGYLLCCTNNFVGKPTGKQLACYAGWCPSDRAAAPASGGGTGCTPWPTRNSKSCCTWARSRRSKTTRSSKPIMSASAARANTPFRGSTPFVTKSP
jgi:transposase